MKLQSVKTGLINFCRNSVQLRWIGVRQVPASKESRVVDAVVALVVEALELLEAFELLERFERFKVVVLLDVDDGLLFDDVCYQFWRILEKEFKVIFYSRSSAGSAGSAGSAWK